MLGAGAIISSFAQCPAALFCSAVLNDEVTNSAETMLRLAARRRDCLHASLPLHIQAERIVGCLGNVPADYRGDDASPWLARVGSGNGPSCQATVSQHAAAAPVKPAGSSPSPSRFDAGNSRFSRSTPAVRDLHASGTSPTIRELSTAHSPLSFPRESMRAAVLYEPKSDMKVESLQIPKPQAGEVLVKTRGERVRVNHS